MTTITLDLPDDFPLQALADMATRENCIITHEGGNRMRVERHGNETVIKLSRYRGQFRGADLPTEPDAG